MIQPLEIPVWKWDSISMDFVIDLPRTPSGIVVDRLTKSAMFIPIKETWSMEKLANAYIHNVVPRFIVPSDIMSDRDSRFLSRFWGKLQQAFGTKLKMSTAFHPMMDGQTERPRILGQSIFR